MTARARALVELGYTEKQALFLELAALQSGYFVRRQFNDFLDRRCGAQGQAFIERVLEKGHAKCVDALDGRRIYQTVGQGLFRALGDENNRNRRSHQLATIRRRLMSLDFCISAESDRWLLTEQDKTSFFKDRDVTEDEMPLELFGRARRFFVDKQPISVLPEGIPEIVFVDAGWKGLSQWELFLRAHRGLIRRLEQSVIVYAGPRPERFVPAERLFGRIVTGGTRGGGLDLGRLKRYFEARKQFDAKEYSTFNQLRLDQLREDRKVFVGERFDTLYAGWSASGNLALPSVGGSGVSFRTSLLKHRYEWISPIYGEERRVCDALNSIASKTST